MNENKNLFLAVALSLAVFVGFDYLNNTLTPKTIPAVKEAEIQLSQDSLSSSPGALNVSSSPVTIKMTREEALKQSQRISIQGPKVHGSIRLQGARFDDITLAEHHEMPDPQSPEIKLLVPQQTGGGYFADFGWVSPTPVILPNDQTIWQADGEVLSVAKPVTLKWENGQGLVFERTIAVDEDYLFTIKDRVINKGTSAVSLKGYGQIVRQTTPQTGGFFILHEGPIGVLNRKLHELSYEDLMKSPKEENTIGGWLGITDKYWLVSLIPDQKTTYQTCFKGEKINGIDQYIVEAISPLYEIKPGDSVEVQHHLFAGAKKLSLLDGYEQKLGFSKFDLAVDFGWFYFLTKPLFYLLSFLNSFFGNMGIAILVMTVLFKLALFPLATRSFRSMSRMKTLQPKIEALKKRYENDKMKLNVEMMELYKREKINPVAGCLPMIIQAPIFFCLYKVLFVTLEMRHAPFFGWINDLSAPDPTSFVNLFGLLPFNPPSFLMIGAWPLLMGLTMLIQQRMNPQPPDPIQAKMMMIMPIMMTFLFAGFPSGVVIYWAWSNGLSMVQQWWIMRQETKNERVNRIIK